MTTGAPAPLVLQAARVIPPRPRRDPFGRAAGVYDAEGAFCHAANVQRSGRLEIRPAALPGQPGMRLPGRHLYGGQLNHHFGHFLCESLARLWALDHLEQPVESILLLPRRPGSGVELQGFHKAVLGQLDLPVPVRVVDQPMIVDELVVPEQGFGNGGLCAGSPAFRSYIHRHFAPDVQPDGPENLYISREGLSLLAGSILGEEALSRNLTRAGYEAFSPEAHDIRTQIARYKAAKRIIAVEGSALHLYGFVGHAAQQVAIITRRSDHTTSNAIADQLRHFCGSEPLVLDTIRREWDIVSGPVRSSKSVSLLDMPALGARLAAAGMVPPAPWIEAKVDIERRIGRISARTGRMLAECPRAG